MRPIERDVPTSKKQENKMQRFALALLAVGLVSMTALAQSSAKTHCPAGYDLVGAVCQSGSTGDVVLPD